MQQQQQSRLNTIEQLDEALGDSENSLVLVGSTVDKTVRTEDDGKPRLHVRSDQGIQPELEKYILNSSKFKLVKWPPAEDSDFNAGYTIREI